MNKDNAVHYFWNSFGWRAYDETSIPDDATLPYITHEGATDIFDREVAQTASLWCRSSDWTEIIAKREEIERAITRGGIIVPYDNGAVWIRRGDPWSRRMSDATDDMIRRIVLNYYVEYIE